MAKQRRRRDLVALWRGKVARSLDQSPDETVMLLGRLVSHRCLDVHQRYLVLEAAIFDIYAPRMVHREQVRRANRKHKRAQPDGT